MQQLKNGFQNQSRTNTRSTSPLFVYIHTVSWLKSHPRTIRHAMHAVILVTLGFTLLNAGVFTMQNGRTSAFTTINGQDYGFMPIEDAKRLLRTQSAQTQLTVSINGTATVLRAQDSGVAINTDKTLDELTNNSGWRKVPVVGAVGKLFTRITPAYDIDMEQLAGKLAPLIDDSTVPAVDAQVRIPADINQPAVVTPAIAGSLFTAETAADELALSIESGNLTAKVGPIAVAPRWTEYDLNTFMPAIETARRATLTFATGGKKFELSGGELAPMLRVNTTGTKLAMTLDKPSLKTYLAKQAVIFYTAPIATKVVKLDGSDVSRIDGTPGKQLDADATAVLAVTAFEDGVNSVAPALAAVTPQTLVTRNYSNTSQGLLKTIEYFALNHPGKYRVAAIELNGAGNRSAFYNADTSIVTASTYKLFVAYGILQKVEAGTLTMESATPNGTIGYCMERMIRISDNACAVTLQAVLGAKEFDAKLAAAGFAATKLNNRTGDKLSTARDEANLLARLYNHELLNTASTDYLFNLMKVQIYRNGIPAGSRGATVVDKVGFLYALNNDIGIVYSPKSTYALVILTDGAGGWTNVRLLSQEVYDFYNR